jgi:ferredoxin
VAFVKRIPAGASKASVCVFPHFLVKIQRNVSRTLSVQGAKVQMTYVVAEPCVNCRYTDCALVCPVEAFHLDDDMLVIHPETCIDCDACVPECPVEAIFAENNVPAEWAKFTPLNAERALSGLPTITARLDPLCE